MERKSALVTEYVKGIATRVLGGSSVILALVEEGASFLTGEGTKVETPPCHGEDALRFVAVTQAFFERRQLLQLSDARLHALDNCSRLRLADESAEDHLAHVSPVHRLGEDLEGKDVVVTVNDETRKAVAFAEHEAAGVCVLDNPAAVRDRGLQPFAQDVWELISGETFRRQHADGNLGPRAVERGAEILAAFILNTDE